MPRLVRPAAVALSLAALAALAPAAGAQTFLDVTSVTATSVRGTLGTSPVIISAIFNTTGFAFNTVGTGVGGSTIDGTSPQFSYANVFGQTAAAADRVGFTQPGAAGNATLSFFFLTPVTNPVFHFANLDAARFSFVVPFNLLTVLAGNGAGGDGFMLVSGVAGDANVGTALEQAPTTTPATAGPRSAYGSVQVTGTYSNIDMFVFSANQSLTDNGSFTISVTPEPATLALMVGGLLVLGGVVRRHRRA